MSTDDKRPWFRFHLLTAVLMMVAAGGMLMVNLSDRPYWTHFAASNRVGPVEGTSTCYGWPAACYVRLDASNVPPGIEPYNIGEFGLKHRDGAYHANDTWAPEIIVNVVVTVLVLLGTALISEVLIRRREG